VGELRPTRRGGERERAGDAERGKRRGDGADGERARVVTRPAAMSPPETATAPKKTP
jgi:hypothetical protein